MGAPAPNAVLADRYLLLEPVASGGMATVWRAKDQVLGRTVAVKLLRDDLAEDPVLAERFRREAVAAARLTHPNIVSVFDTGDQDGRPFIVMEYLEGTTLRDILSEQPELEAGRAVEIVLPILSALAFAHEQGVVHRDVKPANVLVVPDGRVKVTDFGIAKAVAAKDETDLTTTGTMLGTVRYLSPEQVEGTAVDARSDLYAVGIVLYEALTGRPPFAAEHDVATAMLRLTDAPLPPRAVRAGIPKGLEAVVLRAMARSPEDRFQSAEAMRAALERHAGGAPVSPPSGVPTVATPRPEEPAAAPAGSFFRSWMLVPLLVILVAGLLIGIGLGIGALEVGGPLGIRAAPEDAQPAAPQLTQVDLAGAADVDPGGDDAENPDEVPLAVDGDPNTAWGTEHYSTADFGRLKEGVGLWVDLGRVVRVGRITIRSPLPGWAFELFASAEPDRSGQPVRSAGGDSTFEMDESGRIRIDLTDVQARGLLIWLVRLAPDDGRFAAEISEVEVAGEAA